MARVIAKLGDDVSTDVIYPGRYMATVLPTETPQYAFANDPSLNAMLAAQTPPGGVIVAGKNFGCGSSREQACSCLKGYGLTIVARGFARIFLQNSINLGLDIVTAPDIEAEPGDELQVTKDGVIDLTSGRRFAIVALPEARQAIIDAGGLVAYTRQRLLASHGRA